MKKYIGVKMIEAEPMTFAEFEEKEYVLACEDKGRTDGYKVVYEDGYVSWSPRDVFDKAYRRVDGMSFGLAIEAMKKGFKVQRKGWNGKGQYIELAMKVSYMNPDGKVVNVDHEQMGNVAVAFVGTSGVQLGWLASQADMLSEDWQTVS